MTWHRIISHERTFIHPRVFVLLQWTSYYNHAMGYTEKERRKKSAKWPRNWLKEQTAANCQQHPTISLQAQQKKKELVGGLEVTAATLWTMEGRHWIFQMVSVGLLEKQTTWDLFQEPVVMVTGVSANQKCLHPGGSLLQHMSLCLHLESDA